MTLAELGSGWSHERGRRHRFSIEPARHRPLLSQLLGVVHPAGRQVYCTPACRQKAYRGRATGHDIQAVSTTPPRHRRQVTVYQCPNCEQAYLGEQWCPDCQRPCQRLGYGGLCRHCQEPVSIDQLLTATP